MFRKLIIVDEKPPTLAKKPYVAPLVVSWGTLREITQKVGKNGKADGGKGNTSKTKP